MADWLDKMLVRVQEANRRYPSQAGQPIRAGQLRRAPWLEKMYPLSGRAPERKVYQPPAVPFSETLARAGSLYGAPAVTQGQRYEQAWWLHRQELERQLAADPRNQSALARYLQDSVTRIQTRTGRLRLKTQAQQAEQIGALLNSGKLYFRPPDE